jgi:carbonic anhydrase
MSGPIYRRLLLRATGAFLGAAMLTFAGAASAWERELPSSSAKASTPWDYSGERGPDQWGELSSDYAACRQGQEQSPIELRSPRSIQLACEPLRFRYRSSSLFLANEGSALRIGYDRGSFLVISGLSYELVELRVHIPAEHRIDGEVADAELQLIHGNNRGDIAILSVPVRAGLRSNRIFSRLVELAPNKGGEQRYRRNVGINAMFLLPGRKDYFSYRGSLTRPPCTEGVHWYVLRTPLEVAADDLELLAGLVGGSARPLQEIGAREVNLVCPP